MKKLERPGIPQDLLEHAVYQQLFSGGVRIMGKNPANTMQLTGIEELLGLLIKDLEQRLHLIGSGQFARFLQEFEKMFDLDLSPTLERIQTNIGAMGVNADSKEPDVMIYYMIITKLLEALREHAYSQWGYRQIKEKYIQLSGHTFTDKVGDKLQKLAALNEENISLLYNLSFILMLGLHYGSKKFQTTIKRLTTVRINRIVEKIS